MMSEVFMDFYRGRDEEAFLERWKRRYGALTDDEIDALYAMIATAIDTDVKTNYHQIGKMYTYKTIPVGYSDYSAIEQLYLFES